VVPIPLLAHRRLAEDLVAIAAFAGIPLLIVAARRHVAARM
jgi:hypothetical protein